MHLLSLQLSACGLINCISLISLIQILPKQQLLTLSYVKEHHFVLALALHIVIKT